MRPRPVEHDDILSDIQVIILTPKSCSFIKKKSVSSPYEFNPF